MWHSKKAKGGKHGGKMLACFGGTIPVEASSSFADGRQKSLKSHEGLRMAAATLDDSDHDGDHLTTAKRDHSPFSQDKRNVLLSTGGTRVFPTNESPNPRQPFSSANGPTWPDKSLSQPNPNTEAAAAAATAKAAAEGILPPLGATEAKYLRHSHQLNHPPHLHHPKAVTPDADVAAATAIAAAAIVGPAAPVAPLVQQGIDASGKPAKPVKPLSHHTNGGTGRSGGREGEKVQVARFKEEDEDEEDTSCSSESARAAGSSVGSCESTCVRVPRGGMGFGAGIAEGSEELDELRLEVAELRRRVARHEEEAKKLRDEVLYLRACGYEMHLAKSQQQQRRVLTPATSSSRLPLQDVGNLPAAVPGTIMNTFGNPENAMSSLEMMMGMRIAGMAENAELRGSGVAGGGVGRVDEGSAVELAAAGAEAGKAGRGGEQQAQGQKENRENRQPGNGSNGLSGLNGFQERASPRGTGGVEERGRVLQDRGFAGVQDRGSTGVQDRGSTGVQDRGSTGVQDRGSTGVQDRGSTGVRDTRGNASGGDGLSVLPPLWASDSPSKENSHREGGGARGGGGGAAAAAGEADVAVAPAVLFSPRPAATSACPVLPARPATPAAVARPPVYSGRASLEKMRPPPIKGMPLPWESVDDVANLQAGIGCQAAATAAAAAAAGKETRACAGGEAVGEQGKHGIQEEEGDQGVVRSVEGGSTAVGGAGLARSGSGSSAVKSGGRRSGPALVWRVVNGEGVWTLAGMDGSQEQESQSAVVIGAANAPRAAVPDDGDAAAGSATPRAAAAAGSAGAVGAAATAAAAAAAAGAAAAAATAAASGVKAVAAVDHGSAVKAWLDGTAGSLIQSPSVDEPAWAVGVWEEAGVSAEQEALQGYHQMGTCDNELKLTSETSQKMCDNELKLHPTNPFLSPPPADTLLWEEHGAPIAASALQVGPVEAAAAAPETECYLAEDRPKHEQQQQQQQQVTAGVQVHPGESADARPTMKSAMKGASPRTAANATLPATIPPATPPPATPPSAEPSATAPTTPLVHASTPTPGLANPASPAGLPGGLPAGLPAGPEAKPALWAAAVAAATMMTPTAARISDLLFGSSPPPSGPSDPAPPSGPTPHSAPCGPNPASALSPPSDSFSLGVSQGVRGGVGAAGAEGESVGARRRGVGESDSSLTLVRGASCRSSVDTPVFAAGAGAGSRSSLPAMGGEGRGDWEEESEGEESEEESEEGESEEESEGEESEEESESDYSENGSGSDEEEEEERGEVGKVGVGEKSATEDDRSCTSFLSSGGATAAASALSGEFSGFSGELHAYAADAAVNRQGPQADAAARVGERDAQGGVGGGETDGVRFQSILCKSKSPMEASETLQVAAGGHGGGGAAAESELVPEVAREGTGDASDREMAGDSLGYTDQGAGVGIHGKDDAARKEEKAGELGRREEGGGEMVEGEGKKERAWRKESPFGKRRATGVVQDSERRERGVDGGRGLVERDAYQEKGHRGRNPFSSGDEDMSFDEGDAARFRITASVAMATLLSSSRSPLLAFLVVAVLVLACASSAAYAQYSGKFAVRAIENALRKKRLTTAITYFRKSGFNKTLAERLPTGKYTFLVPINSGWNKMSTWARGQIRSNNTRLWQIFAYHFIKERYTKVQLAWYPPGTELPTGMGKQVIRRLPTKDPQYAKPGQHRGAYIEMGEIFQDGHVIVHGVNNVLVPNFKRLNAFSPVEMETRRFIGPVLLLAVLLLGALVAARAQYSSANALKQIEAALRRKKMTTTITYMRECGFNNTLVKNLPTSRATLLLPMNTGWNKLSAYTRNLIRKDPTKMWQVFAYHMLAGRYMYKELVKIPYNKLIGTGHGDFKVRRFPTKLAQFGKPGTHGGAYVKVNNVYQDPHVAIHGVNNVMVPLFTE
ncbi:unnamed protein product [Closterium sp. Yama58-4]|nr:unnamed protein product [Closterium sp. Yama58-4]